MKLRDIKIRKFLNIGAFIIFVLIVSLGCISRYQANKLEQQTIDLYEHPFSVDLSLSDLKSDVLVMNNMLKDINLTKDVARISLILQKMEVQKADVFKQFDFLYHQYIGHKADLDNAYNNFVKWNTINEETLRILHDGKVDEAIKRTQFDGVGGICLSTFFKDIDGIKKNAQNHGNQLLLNAADANDDLNIQIIKWILLSFMVIFFLYLGLIKLFRTPLIELNTSIRLFREGKTDARCNYVASNEFGELSESFNKLADFIQINSTLNEKAIKLDQLMLGEEDAHRFCHRLLSALLDDTWSQMGAVYLLNEDKTKFEYFECIGMIAAACKAFSAKRFEGEFGQVLATKKMQHITHIPEDSRFTFATVTGEFLPREIITIPVIVSDEIVAVISLAKIKDYSPGSLNLLNMIQGTLNARFGGILANRKNIEFSQKLEYQNIELETQKNELSAQTNQLTKQNVELEMQKKQLDESNKLKTAFLSNMSHELRTPLNSVIALSGVLNRRLSGKVPEEEYSYLEVIERNGKNLLLLINDILDLSRIEAGHEEIDITTFNINNLISEIVEMIDPQANQKSITLRYIPNDKFSDIKSDYNKLRHILQNIVGNAVKFTEKGLVEITTQEFEKEFCITISDSGIGIEKGNLSGIFEEFRQADSSNSRKYGGTGLGLSISKKYAEMLGGRIEVESDYGTGSKFKIILPLCLELEQIAEESVSDIYLPETNLSEKNFGQTSVSEKTILIVEDTEAMVIQMKDILDNQGYNLMVAHNGSEALEQIYRKMPDGVILDLMMPEVDGFEVLKYIREKTISKDLPVIVLTAKYVTKDELLFLKNNNIHQLIQKGDINKNKLLKAVSSMVYNETKEKEKVKGPVSIVGTPVILVIEDNPDNMLTIKALLPEKYKVVEAEDGKTGIEKACQYHPNLVLMDIALPGINGIEALKEIRKDDSLKHLPIIAVSASAMKGDKENLMSYGFDGYISKPIDDQQFSKIIEEWIG
jgi:signal transduction histidine kinase/CheY-like chemotaxis protein